MLLRRLVRWILVLGRARAGRLTIRGSALAMGAIAALSLAPAAAPAGTNTAPTLVANSAARLSVDSGTPMSIALDAGDRDPGDAVDIAALFLPTGASLQVQNGNPAKAVFRWRPTHAGAFAITFTAKDHGTPRLAVTKTITVIVHSAAAASAQAVSHWAFVEIPVRARSAPSTISRTVAELGTTTPEHTQNLVLVLRRVDRPHGVTWYQVRLPILPNNSTGWVQSTVLSGLHTVSTHLVVDRSALTATLYRNGKPIFRTPVGVGQDRWPTPPGQFYVRDLLIGYTDPTYGPAAFGTSARSGVLTDWPGGGYIGIHGTNEPGILPGRVSHGCIRMPNAAVLELKRLMPVGTPLTIR